MCSYPAGVVAPFSLKRFCEARASVQIAEAILHNVITDDNLYLMPAQTGKLLAATARLLDLASVQLACEDTETEEVSP
jgi:hypothetical protein